MQEKITVFKWLDKWLSGYALHRVRTNTYENYKWAVQKIKQYLNDVNIDEFEELDAQGLLNELGMLGFAKSSINKIKIVLKQSFDKAITNHLIKESPCKDLYIPIEAGEKDVKPLTQTEQALVEQACHKDLNGSLMIFLLHTGLRRNELCNLKWEDYDLKQKTIYVRESKTKAGIRTIPLLSICERVIAVQPKINEYIFNSKNHTPITASVLKKTYLRLRKSTGIENFTNHVCRHTFATRLLEAGADPKSIASLLGHTSVAFMLNQYTQVQSEHLKNQMNLLEQDK